MSRVIGILAFVAILALLQGCGSAAPATQGQKSFFLVQKPTDNNFVAIIKFWDEKNEVYKCEIFTDPAVVEGIKKISDGKIHYVSEDEMKEMREVCEASSKGKRWDAKDQDVLLEGATANEESRRWDIFPGTKWCGVDDEAENDSDFGPQEDTDRCCQAHDKCDDLMEVGETKHNLTNDSRYKSLSCKCDEDFYNCLHKVDTWTSNAVGYSYFTLLGRECYEENYPFTDKCKKYRTILEIFCVEYERDTSKPKVYQWVEAKNFKK